MNLSASCWKLLNSTYSTPRSVASQMATDGLWKRGDTRAIARKNSPRSAIAKKMRGPVIMEPLSVPKQESITTPAMTAAPAVPSTGIRSAAVAAISLEPAISGSGTT